METLFGQDEMTVGNSGEVTAAGSVLTVAEMPEGTRYRDVERGHTYTVTKRNINGAGYPVDEGKGYVEVADENNETRLIDLYGHEGSEEHSITEFTKTSEPLPFVYAYEYKAKGKGIIADFRKLLETGDIKDRKSVV